MEIPITIATIIALEWSERIPAFIDAQETFVFFGIPTGAEKGAVYDCAVEMVLARTDDLDAEAMWEIIDKSSAYNRTEFEFTEGLISIHWEQRL